jgi:hypothetical protein
VRLGSPLPSAAPRRCGALWAVLLLAALPLAGSCLNPHPDPYPQVQDSPDLSAAATPGPERVTSEDGLEAEPQSAGAGQSPASPTTDLGPAIAPPPAAQPPGVPMSGGEAPDAGVPPFDAGIDDEASDASPL